MPVNDRSAKHFQMRTGIIGAHDYHVVDMAHLPSHPPYDGHLVGGVFSTRACLKGLVYFREGSLGRIRKDTPAKETGCLAVGDNRFTRRRFNHEDADRDSLKECREDPVTAVELLAPDA
ncbi:MAG: hypothetical protein A4E36_01727 [Methanoregulaceae archaeon PtaB.Bin009]|nr:MAG: hypothetical protein A4E36_01727 [Methanoregulaceae archaeon PtaB.Bin009]